MTERRWLVISQFMVLVLSRFKDIPDCHGFKPKCEDQTRCDSLIREIIECMPPDPIYPPRSQPAGAAVQNKT